MLGLVLLRLGGSLEAAIACLFLDKDVDIENPFLRRSVVA